MNINEVIPCWQRNGTLHMAYTGNMGKIWLLAGFLVVLLFELLIAARTLIVGPAGQSVCLYDVRKYDLCKKVLSYFNVTWNVSP